MASFRDLTGQRHVQFPLGSEHATVADVAAEAVGRLNLPTQSQRGLPLDYQLRASDGTLLRPSESLADSRVRDLLAEGQVTAVPRLTAA
jgi:hypothetical protein